MSGLEITVIVAGLLIGYWLVSMMTQKKRSVRKQPGFAEEAFKEPTKPDAQDVSPSWSQVLQVDENASLEEIRQAYKTQISQYHPDKVAALGVELQLLADKKSKEISQAYRTALKLHGLEP